MGQQQLLLLVLGFIIVTVAVAVAINIFISRSGMVAEQHLAQTINDCIDIAQKAQAWVKKPTELGGGGWSFENFTLSAINYPDSSNYAKYEILNKTKDSLTIRAVTKEGKKVTLGVTLSSIGKPVIE